MTDWLSPDAVPEQSELDKRDPRNPDNLDNKREKYTTKSHRDVVEVGEERWQSRSQFTDSPGESVKI